MLVVGVLSVFLYFMACGGEEKAECSVSSANPQVAEVVTNYVGLHDAHFSVRINELTATDEDIGFLIATSPIPSDEAKTKQGYITRAFSSTSAATQTRPLYMFTHSETQYEAATTTGSEFPDSISTADILQENTCYTLYIYKQDKVDAHSFTTKSSASIPSTKTKQAVRDFNKGFVSVYGSPAVNTLFAIEYKTSELTYAAVRLPTLVLESGYVFKSGSDSSLSRILSCNKTLICVSNNDNIKIVRADVDVGVAVVSAPGVGGVSRIGEDPNEPGVFHRFNIVAITK